MWTKQLRIWRFLLCTLFAVSALSYAVRADEEVPSESQCRPYVEKALKELESGDAEDSGEKNDSSEVSVDNDSKEDSVENSETEKDDDSKEDSDNPSVKLADEPYAAQASAENKDVDDDSKEDTEVDKGDEESSEANDDNDDDNDKADENDNDDSEEEKKDDNEDSMEEASADEKDDDESNEESKDADVNETDDDDSSKEEKDSKEEQDSKEDQDSKEEQDSKEDKDSKEDNDSKEEDDEKDDDDNKTSEETETDKEEDNLSENASAEKSEDKDESDEDDSKQVEDTNDDDSKEDDEVNKDKSEENEKDDESNEENAETKTGDDAESEEDNVEKEDDSKENDTDDGDDDDSSADEKDDSPEEEELLKIADIPENLRSRDHINQILRLDEETSEDELTVEKSAEIILRDIKRLYENSIEPLETLYKYRDLSNRHFGDPEIFSKPLVLFMGPWSGGKSTMINYLTGLEYTEWSLRTGAEPSPAYFNILMHGKEPEVLDGTQLAADWTFSGLQKFGQGLEERLRGLKYPSKILEKVNIVEIPGILEVRKQVSRVFPFNDACQWFIDRADIIFLVYDPSKLDVGPETEAILDQLKGRESQTRIVLNKADVVKPEELMRVQSALIWNISPLMSSAAPPVMYTVSLWSLPFEDSAPSRLLLAQERELLRDLRRAVDRRIDNKIASARRFAVRVRNHAKMVDCYLTTYFNHKTIFGNRKLIADAIIENPQSYHIYEGLSTLTNISRYDLPDPETYRDFFRLNPLYDFQQLSATCTYFRGCPITKLDVAIAYDFPELVGKYKKMVENVTPQGMPKS